MRIAAVTIWVLISFVSLHAAEPMTDADAILKLCDAARERRIASWEKDIRELERLKAEAQKILSSYRRAAVSKRVNRTTEARNGNIIFPSVPAKQAAVAAAAKSVATAENGIARGHELIDKAKAAATRGEVEFVPVLSPRLAVGEVGATTADVEIVQIIDRQNMLVSGQVGGPLAEVRTVWLSGVDTSALADGQSLSLANFTLKVVGNKTYETAIGSTKTVMRLQRLDMEPVFKLAKEKATTK